MSVDLSLFFCSDDASGDVRGFNVDLISAGKYIHTRKSYQIYQGDWFIHVPSWHHASVSLTSIILARKAHNVRVLRTNSNNLTH